MPGEVNTEERGYIYMQITMEAVFISRRAGDYKTHSVRVLLSLCHAFIKGCTSHWLFLLGLFNVFYDLIAYVLSFDAVISHLGP